MTVEFAQLNKHAKYHFHCITGPDPTLPDCDVSWVASHPHDGAYLIVENMSDDGPRYFGCVREELTEIAS